MNQKKILQIAVPLAIVLIVAGIWWVKNVRPSSGEEAVPPVDNADFVLEAAELDLEALKAYGLPIVVDFGADWCPPCRAFFPILQEAHEALLGQAIIKYVDTEKSPGLARDYPISAIPTQLLIRGDGSPYVPSAEIENLRISFKYYESKDTGEHMLTLHEGGLTEEQFYAILEDMGARP